MTANPNEALARTAGQQFTREDFARCLVLANELGLGEVPREALRRALNASLANGGTLEKAARQFLDAFNANCHLLDMFPDELAEKREALGDALASPSPIPAGAVALRERAQRIIENMIPYSWLGPEADGNMVANKAKEFVAALDQAGCLASQPPATTMRHTLTIDEMPHQGHEPKPSKSAATTSPMRDEALAAEWRELELLANDNRFSHELIGIRVRNFFAAPVGEQK